MKDYTKILHEILEKRILVLDGAMGTMIQCYNFSEEDYRGNKFKDYEYLLKGNNPLEVAYNKKLQLFVYGSTWDIIKDAFPAEDIQRLSPKENHLYRINTKNFNIVKTKVACNFSELDRYLYHSPKKKSCTTDTVQGFVPRYTNKDRQTSIFKNVKASDGSTIRRVR